MTNLTLTYLGREFLLEDLQIHVPHAPWCWKIYLQNWVICGVDVGKYSSTMEYMGVGLRHVSGIYRDITDDSSTCG